MSLLCDLLKNIVDLLCDDVVELTTGVTAQVSVTAWNDLDPKSQSAIDKIDQIHDGATAPSYTPSDAGDENAKVDTSNMTTEQMGDDACERARAAYRRACEDNPSDQEASSTSLYEARGVLVDLRAQADPT